MTRDTIGNYNTIQYDVSLFASLHLVSSVLASRSPSIRPPAVSSSALNSSLSSVHLCWKQKLFNSRASTRRYPVHGLPSLIFKGYYINLSTPEFFGQNNSVELNFLLKIILSSWNFFVTVTYVRYSNSITSKRRKNLTTLQYICNIYFRGT